MSTACSKRRMGFYSQQDGAAIPRHWSSCIQKSISGILKQQTGLKKKHTIHGRYNKHITLVPSISFCKSTQYFWEQRRIGAINSA